MAGQTTKPYRNTLSGSVGAGMGSLFNPSGRKYYILEHKVTSKYHRAGESQEIIVDNIELGRDSHCQVRFDESFKTVSRHHAAIVRDGENWKLIQISHTNTTLLNGRPVQTEWYLQNGDEIQLSINGPKLGFIIPTGKKATVGSIGLTRRLSLFRQQALRPYKQAIAGLAAVLVLTVGGLTAWNLSLKRDFDKQIAEARKNLSSIMSKNEELTKLMEESKKEQHRLDSLMKLKPKERKVYVERNPNPNPNPNPTPTTNLQSCENDVYFIRTKKVVVTDGTDEVPIKCGWVATGFLLDDGRFVTAKHCVEGWKFGNVPDSEEELSLLLAGMSFEGWKVVAYLEATSKNGSFTFKSTDFVMNHSTEVKKSISDELSYIQAPLDRYDWAYIKTSRKGQIHADAQLSNNLPTGADLDILGFPHGWGANDTNDFSPLYGSCKTARNGTDGGLIRVSARNYEPGNSGGPVFYNNNGKITVVGIVSSHRYQGEDKKDSSHGAIVPIGNIY